MVGRAFTMESRGVPDPRRVADVALAAAAGRAQTEAVYIEPSPGNEDAYAITLERGAPGAP